MTTPTAERIRELREKIRQSVLICYGEPCDIGDLIFILDAHASLLEEVERLTHLHKLDHSLADQWLARAEKAEAELAAAKQKASELFTEANNLREEAK